MKDAILLTIFIIFILVVITPLLLLILNKPKQSLSEKIDNSLNKKKEIFETDYTENAKLRVQKTFTILKKVVTYVFLAIMAIIVLIPFYYMINISLQSNNEVLNSPQLHYFPQEISFNNYPAVFMYKSSAMGNINFPRYLLNTVIVAIFSTLLGTIASIIVAFALSRLNFKGRELIFTILLATMMIPGEMMVISNYKTISAVGLAWVGDQKQIDIGPYLAMVVPFFIGVFNIYMLRNTFKQVPNELYYAAKVDGVSDLKYLFRVMVPMAKSSIVTIVILKVMGTWNSYIWPNLVTINDPQFRLVTSWLRTGFVAEGETGRTFINYQMMAAIIVTVPLLILFVVFRKYIMSGVSRSGIKG